MSIKFEFLLKGQNKFMQKEISEEEYFDLEENENIDINSVPKLPQPYLYLNISTKEILLVVAILEINNDKRIFKQTIWNNGDNILTERIDIGNDSYKEIILSFKIDEITGLYETVRLFIGDNFTVPTYHSLIHKDTDGRDVEKRFDTEFFIEMIKQGLIQ